MNNFLPGAALGVAWGLSFLAVILVLAYRRAGLRITTCVLALLIAAYWAWGSAPDWWKAVVSIPLGFLCLLNIRVCV